MNRVNVTKSHGSWTLTAQEVAHAMPVLQSVHPALQGLPPPRLAMMRRLAQRGTVRDGALRTALSRACATGSLHVSDGRYRLGPASLAEAATARQLLDRRPGYVLAVIREGAAAERAGLHELLVRAGLRPLQRSMWIGARTRADHLGPALEAAGFAAAVMVFATDEVAGATRAELLRLWRIPERAAVLRRFQSQLRAHLGDERASGDERAWRCIEAAPVWYRVAVRDEPPFPLDLCGTGYPLAALNADWHRLLAALSPQLVALWQAEAG